jgi:signal transduction histidine kinase
LTVMQRTMTAVTAATAVLVCGVLPVVRGGADVRSVILIAVAWAALATTAAATARGLVRTGARAGRLAQELDTAHERRSTAEVELARLHGDLRTLAVRTLPDAIEGLQAGTAAQSVFAALTWPYDAGARAFAETALRELAHSERRFTAAQAACVTALSRVQARTVRTLADLRDMQNRHDEAVLGDLLSLDHSVSQIGLLTDRLALLMGGRSSRTWNRPIALESIMRGAVGRIAAYRRVCLRASSPVCLSGHAAEALMHLLAELMDNAANFSPPTEQVHVRAREEAAGLVITIEDKGLRMAGAALRYATEAVTHEVDDLASLRGTRLGLAVVGRLAARYGITVDFHVPARGGTTVVVRVPRRLLVRESGSTPPVRVRDVPFGKTAGGPKPAASAPPVVSPKEPTAVGSAPVLPRTTPNGLPVRTRGLSTATRRPGRADTAASLPQPRPARRPHDSAGAVFGGFHHGVQSGRQSRPKPHETTDPPCE